VHVANSHFDQQFAIKCKFQWHEEFKCIELPDRIWILTLSAPLYILSRQTCNDSHYIHVMCPVLLPKLLGSNYFNYCWIARLPIRHFDWQLSIHQDISSVFLFITYRTRKVPFSVHQDIFTFFSFLHFFVKIKILLQAFCGWTVSADHSSNLVIAQFTLENNFHGTVHVKVSKSLTI